MRHRWLAGSGEEPPYFDASNIVFENQGNFNTGVYFIKLENKGKVTSNKIIKN